MCKVGGVGELGETPKIPNVFSLKSQKLETWDFKNIEMVGQPIIVFGWSPFSQFLMSSFSLNISKVSTLCNYNVFPT